MQTGTQVRSRTVIQSDDRANGLDDGTPIIPIGTIGTVLGESKDHLSGNAKLKSGCEDCILVQFELPSGKHSFDVKPQEVISYD